MTNRHISLMCLNFYVNEPIWAPKELYLPSSFYNSFTKTSTQFVILQTFTSMHCHLEYNKILNHANYNSQLETSVVIA